MTAEEKYKQTIKYLKTGKKISFRDAIDQKCIDCFGYQREEVKKCQDDECVLYYYKTLTNSKK